jgi:hypothetical protein
MEFIFITFSVFQFSKPRPVKEDALENIELILKTLFTVHNDTFVSNKSQFANMAFMSATLRTSQPDKSAEKLPLFKNIEFIVIALLVTQYSNPCPVKEDAFKNIESINSRLRTFQPERSELNMLQFANIESTLLTIDGNVVGTVVKLLQFENAVVNETMLSKKLVQIDNVLWYWEKTPPPVTKEGNPAISKIRTVTGPSVPVYR